MKLDCDAAADADDKIILEDANIIMSKMMSVAMEL